MATFTGTSGNDNFIGTVDADLFDLRPGGGGIGQGGSDTADGDDGDDVFRMGDTLDASDAIDGGDGNDVLKLDGQIFNLTMGATTVVNVETLVLARGHNYTVTTNDATVAKHATLTVDAGGLDAGNTLTFDGTAETNGAFAFVCGDGDDHFTGGARADTFTVNGGGNDQLLGRAGDDTFVVDGSQLSNSDVISGGDGYDVLKFKGSDSQHLSGLQGVEEVRLVGGAPFSLAEAPSGLVVVGSRHGDTIDAGTSFGTFTLMGGRGNDTLIGSKGESVLVAGRGHDTLVAHAFTHTIFQFEMAQLTKADSFDVSDTNNFGTIEFTDSGTLLGDQLEKGDRHWTLLFANGDDTFVSPDWLVKFELDGGAGNDYFDVSARVGGTSVGDSMLLGGGGDDTLIGSVFNEAFVGGDGNDIIHFEAGNGFDHIYGGAGDDTFYGGTHSTYIDFDGGSGTDTLILNDDFNTVFIAGTKVETVYLTTGHHYSLTTYDSWFIDGTDLGAGDALTLNGHFFGAGPLNVAGGAADDTMLGSDANDVFSGGAGADHLTGNSGADTFRYAAPGESTSTTYDTVTDFAAAADFFDLDVTIDGFDGQVASAVAINAATFDADIALATAGAFALAGLARALVLDTGTNGGDLDGHSFLIVDADGDKVYTANSDYVIDITGYTGTLTGANFI